MPGWFRVLKIATVPQLQYSDKVVAVPAVAVHRQGVDVPVNMQRRSLAVGSASESVHRLIWWTSQFATETGCFPQLGAMKGFFGAFCAIFALLWVVPKMSASFSSLR